MAFKDHYAFVTGPTGLTVLDIAVLAAPVVIAVHPLPYFENEDVDLCGSILTIVNERETRDLGSIVYVFDVSIPASPRLLSASVIGATGGSERGSGHIATFVEPDCSMACIDGGARVGEFDLSNPAAPRSLGKFESVASLSANFKVTHETSRDGSGFLWSVGGGGAAGYKLTKDPLAPRLVASMSADGVNRPRTTTSILQNSQRIGGTLYVTEEDYVDTDEVPPGGCRGQGKFETWSQSTMSVGGITPVDTWMTELNGSDSKAAAAVNCSSHWFEVVGDVAAVGWYEQGTRFLDVHDPADIRQVGFHLPANGSAWAAYWSPTDPTRSIVYTADAYLGVQVLRIDRSVEPSTMSTVTAPSPHRGSPAPRRICRPRPGASPASG